MSNKEKLNKIEVTSIEINPTKLCLQQGTGTTVSAIIHPHNATNKNLIWKSSNPKVATSKSGAICAVSLGSATVYAFSEEDDTIVAHCFVTVIPRRTINVESLMLSYSNVTLSVGERFILSAYVYPIDASNKNVKWHSTDEKVAAVNGNGVVIAKGMGKTTIVATAQDDSRAYDMCIVNVSNDC